MDCKGLEQLLSTKRPDDLAPEDRAAAEAHLAECASCREKWSPGYESRELHQAVKELDGARSVKSTVLARIRGETPEGAEPEAPKQIGGYEVLGFVGRGGMGNVFKARQVSMDRLVALKILPSRLASNEAFVERLTREARAAARLSHPNIVHAYDVGEADGHYYFAMEYVDGEGLDAVLRREGPLEQNRARRLMMQVTSALTAAHEAGVIHRDVKPSNILLDRKGRARVADFGLAKRLEGDATTAAIGESLGTPAYAAPEVCTGHDIDARADLYSLGATFFHLLAGHPPFQDPDAAQVVVRQVREQPPSLAEVARHLDPRLCRIIDRLLRKDPGERHPSARALLDELEALGDLKPNDSALHDAPTAPLRPGQKLLQEFEAQQRSGQRRRPTRRLALGAAAVVIAVIGIVYALQRRGPGPREGASAPQPASASAAEATPQARLEHNAEVVLRRAQRAAALGQWVTVARELDLLAAKYADTQVYPSNRIAIDELRARAERELGGEVVRPTAVAVREPVLVPGEWVSLFDGATLNGWRVVEHFRVPPKYGDGRGGEVSVADGQIVLGAGRPATGIAWTGAFPRVDYEVAVEVMQTAKPDCFELVFPIGESHCQLEAGGFGGHVVGLSLVDDRWGTENPTTRHMRFEGGKWYEVRLRVTSPRIEAWVDEGKVIDLPTAGHAFSIASDRQPLLPFGISAWGTSAAVRRVRMRPLAPGAGPARPEAPGRWVALFDGQTLNGWRVLRDGGFAQGGPVRIEGGRLLLGRGAPRTGIAWTGDVPSEDYEIAVTARREAGRDSFCGLYFPIGDAVCTLSVGGYGGRWLGLANVDGLNPTQGGVGGQVAFEAGRWHRIRLRVTKADVQGWVDDELVFDVPRQGHTFTPSLGDVPTKLAVVTWETSAGIKGIWMRRAGLEAPAEAGRWVSLFDGKTLDGWRVVEEFPEGIPGGRVFKGGEARVEDGNLVLEQSDPYAGVACTRDVPRTDYELSLEAMRVEGADCFCLVVFPVGEAGGDLEIGGWGGSTVGVGLVDGQGVPDNVTAKQVEIENGRWYTVRLRVGGAKVEAWLDDQKVVDLSTAAHTLSLFGAWQPMAPLGLGSARCQGTFRNIKYRLLRPEEPGGWAALFDGKSLGGWRVIERFPTVKPEEGDGTGGQARVADGRIVLERGRPVSAIAWQGEFPRENYELSIEAMRVDGACDFCNVAFPVGDSRTTLCVGTWPNRLELRYLHGQVKVEDRRKDVDFQRNRWYRVGVRVTPASIRVTLDDETLIDLPRRGLRFYASAHHTELRPFGVATWDTKAAYREIRVRRLGPQAGDIVADEAFERELGDWVSLFDGKSLGQWRAVERFPDDVNEEGDGAGGQVRVHDGQILIDPGNPLSGITWTGAFPTIDYEVEVETRRVDQRNAFCNLIFPVGDSSSALYIGARRGTVAGVFQVDRRFFLDGNVTTRQRQFEQGRWYRVRLRVTGERVAAWVDDERLFSVSRAAHALGAAPRRVAPLLPFGVGTFNAGTALRAIRVRQSTRKPPPRLPDQPGEWIALFDGETLDGWQTLNTGDYARCGQVHAADGSLVLGRGDALTGVLWRGDLPLVGYEVSVEARREPGSDAYWYLFFPTSDGGSRLDVGESRGRLLGLTLVDGQSYHHNDTGRETDIAIGRWFRVRLRVTEERIEAWLDDDKAVDLEREGRRLGPPHSEAGLDSLVLGTCYATASFRNVRIQRLPSKPEPRPKLFTTPKEATVALSACAQWLDTGLYLTEGKAYDIAAMGRWGFWRTVSRTADGSPRNPKHRTPHCGPMAYNLIGRVGRHGRVVPIGSGCRVEPKQPGRLYLQMNDEYVKDNWGTLHVRVAGPLIADVTAPLLSRFTKGLAELRVDARQDWTFSGAELRRGDIVLITAEGTCKVQPLQTTPDAWGLNKGLGAHRLGALLARIGEHGVRVNAGTLSLIEAREPGRLYLAVHDADRADNTGGYNVEIRTAPALRGPADQPAAPGLRSTLAATLRAHGGPVTDVAFSPDGTRLASCSADGSLRVWDTRTWKCVWALAPAVGPVQALAFSPDGKRIAFAGQDRTVRLWDVGGRECAHTLKGHLGPVVAVAFFPDGKQLASASEDRLVALWDAVAGRLLGPLPRHDARPVLAICPDGERLASATHSGQLRIWDATTRQCVHRVFARASRCEAVAWSPDGKRLATTGSPASVHVWDGATGKWLRSLDGPGWQLDDVAFSPDGKVIAACGAERTWWAWDATTYAHLTTIEGHQGEVTALAFSPDSKLLATASADRTIQLWALELREGGERQPAEPEAAWQALFDGKTLAGWKIAEDGPYARHGQVAVEDGRIVLHAGQTLTGLARQQDFPAMDYEIALEAMRIEGKFDFCSIDFPVGPSVCTWLIGGWGGSVSGLDTVDGRAANENETTRQVRFQRGRWHRIRLRVANAKVEGWIDDAKVVDLETAGRQLAVQAWRSPLRPFGIFSWETTSALRNIRLRRLGDEPAGAPAEP